MQKKRTFICIQGDKDENKNFFQNSNICISMTVQINDFSRKQNFNKDLRKFKFDWIKPLSSTIVSK